MEHLKVHRQIQIPDSSYINSAGGDQMEATDFINVEMKELRKPLLGKTITVDTLDGKSIKDVLKRADENLLASSIILVSL